MIPLFSHVPQLQTPVVFPSKWAWVKTGIGINLERVQTYSRLYPFAVPAQHYLIRLLMSISVPMDIPLERYYDRVDGKARNLSMALQMTSPYYKGKIHQGVFYGHGSTEVILLDEDYFDYMWVSKNWEKASPVKVLQHPKSDLGLFVPLGKNYSDETGLSIISVNIAMLAVMYRSFLKQQRGAESSQTPYMFLGSYVLPNMLNSHLDLAIFNRYYRMTFGITEPNNIPRFKHSFNLLNYNTQLDLALKQAVENATRQHRNFNATLHTLPAVVKENMADVLVMPDMFATMQNDWALQVARLRAVCFLIDICGSTAAATDRTQMARLLRAYAHNNIKPMIEQMLPKELAEQAFTDMEKIEETVRR